MSERVYDIKQAADELAFTPQYIRMLIHNGKLRAEQVPVSPGARVTKWVMTDADLEEFRSNVTSRSGRQDNRTKWLIYSTFVEMEGIIKFLEEQGYGEVALTIQPANQLQAIPDWLKERLDGQVED
jgi:hypothetical protein